MSDKDIKSAIQPEVRSLNSRDGTLGSPDESGSKAYASGADGKPVALGSVEEDEEAYVSTLTAEQERKVIRKVDLHMLPWMCLLYLLSFLDRSAIGNAVIFGMRNDLGLNGAAGDQRYRLALLLFFVPYALCEVPSNILLKKLKPSIWFSVITIGVGICMACQGVVHNDSGLIATRWFLGVAEAGLFPGVNYLMRGWYRNGEFSIRAAIFFSAASLAGAFGGLLAAAINQMNGVGGYAGWRWIFIIIGLVTFVAGIASFWLVPDFPEDAKFLTEEERAFVIGRLQRDQVFSAKGEKFSFNSIIKAFADWKMWLGALIYTGSDGPLYSISLFLPTIVRGTFPGRSATEVNLLTVPIYVLACALVLTYGFLTARLGRRALAIMISLSIAVAGYIILLASRNNALSYAATYIVAAGIYPCIPMTISLTSNVEGVYKRGTVIGFIISFGNLNGLVTSGFVYRSQDAVRYTLGHAVILGYVSMGLITCALFWFGISRENRIRDSGARDETILDPSIPYAERRRIAEEAHEKRIADIQANGGIFKAYKLILAKTHSLPGGVYTSVSDARAKKGDDYSGYRYRV